MLAGQLLLSGKYARAVLRAGRGTVHSVFDSTIYLQANNSLCCLGDAGLVSGPLNIRSSLTNREGQPNFSECTRGDEWCFESQRLTIASGYNLNAANCDHWHPHNNCHKPGSKSLNQSVRLVTNIARHALQYNALPNNSITQLTESKLSAGLTALGQWINQSSRPNSTIIPIEVAEIVGCGDGLTPAGDDILCGAMVALHILDIQPTATILTDWVKKTAPDLTSEISFAHLACASEGQGIEFLHIFIEQLLDHNVNNELLEAATKTLIHYGGSSGYYALQGALCAVTKYRH